LYFQIDARTVLPPVYDIFGFARIVNFSD